MTIVTVLLLGAGILLLASSLDGSSLKDTFTKIISGQSINWSGTTPSGPTVSAGAAGGGSSSAG